ncbi:MAG: cytochrome c4 [Methylophilaceae bacterium]|nr:cytochrome c4 [Methylophilaceae bacterium]MBL6726749.1 cytochrome c4 [Methylophilaceae bacterium]MBL6728534.1 cytochrome c4 [Methylophilaceae bacterium]MBL6790633.1 cytochrome c4 [Methylophilaceae bacterium]
MKILKILYFVTLMYINSHVYANDDSSIDLEQAKKIVNNLCIACHGIDGNSSIPANPNLSAQHAGYITKQLMQFKNGERENAVMKGMVASLSEEDMVNLGFYFEQQKQKLLTASSNGKNSLGEKIYRAGVASKNIPACASCHGPAGHGIPDLYPRLNSQHADYTVSQLNAFRLEKRMNDNAMMMRTIAQKLTEKEMSAVADYIQGLR